MKTSMIRQAASPKPTPRTHLEIGSQIFHNGAPVQLLYRVAHDKHQETWRVRPLFVEAPDRDEEFYPSDLISYLHTIRTHAWSRAA
jgi:hypothetical protein